MPFFIPFSIIIFPSFAVLFLLRSQNYNRDFTLVIVASIIFDFFSGFEFGAFIFAVILAALIVYLIKKEFAISSNSLLVSVFFSLLIILFVFSFVFILLKLPIKYIITQLPVLGIESLITIFVLIIFYDLPKISDKKNK